MHAKMPPRLLRFTWKSSQAFLYNSLVHQNINKSVSHVHNHDLGIAKVPCHFSILFLLNANTV